MNPNQPAMLESITGKPQEICYSQLFHHCAEQLVVENYTNFNQSAAPVQIMYYHRGSWMEFSKDVLDSLRHAFENNKTVIVLLINGAKYIFDCLRMLQIDMGSGNQRSISWIDEKGICFFPKTFIEEESMNEKSESFGNTEIQIDRYGSDGKRKRLDLNKDEKEDEVSSSFKLIKFDDNVDSSNSESLISKFLETSKWPNTIFLTQKDHISYLSVSDLFLSSITKVDPGATINAIHQCVHSFPNETTRHKVFEQQNESIKASRGSSNIVYAWYSTSSETISRTLIHGFALPDKTSRLPPYGVGIYLTPVSLPHLSAMQHEADNNGEKHLILCRVILGTVEKVEVGSQQNSPSNGNFDSGSDDPKNPNWYVIWGLNMNRNILPEFIVSYRPSIQVIGQFGAPNYTRYSFGKLLALHTRLPTNKLLKAISIYNNFLEGKLTEDIFIRRLRSIIGDQKFRFIIEEEI